MSYQDRLARVIPGGAHTYSRGFDQFPANAPQILERGKGAYVWDPAGNKYLDYGMALRAVTLGYSNERVNLAAWKQIENGNNLTRASLIELEAAELLTSLIPGAEMVKFAKNGSNVTTAAIKIARSYTGKRFVCVPRQQPFFSFDDWFIGVTEVKRGIPAEHAGSTLVFEYNDISTLATLFEKFPDQIAAVIMEPATTDTPCDCAELSVSSSCSSCPNKSKNFLHQVEEICKKNGTLFILDEMITGFRWGITGAADYFGVKPDLMTFGKGMANGFSVAAVAGRRDVMSVGGIDNLGMERTFLLSTTHGGEMSSLGAFVETVKIYKELNVCDHLWDYGRKFKNEIGDLIVQQNLEEHFELIGPPISLAYVAKDQNMKVSNSFKTLVAQELLKNGVIMPWIAISLSHCDEELDITIRAFRKAFSIYKNALSSGVHNYLNGPEIKPVFRKYN